MENPCPFCELNVESSLIKRHLVYGNGLHPTLSRCPRRIVASGSAASISGVCPKGYDVAVVGINAEGDNTHIPVKSKTKKR